ncbi:Ficolin-2 [Holothuria leucospilota]|uniref:Ficolin-2 n=1 Tax=Holothuria leucospilota TaxID=206669 RepID=A0A9Q1BWG4_HOLLE|nr:Ficolin-2 [Holothuria leucospilota]
MMASSNSFCTVLFVLGVCSFFLDNLSAKGNDQLPSDNTIHGQGSTFFFYQKPQYPRDCTEVRDSCSSPVSSGVYLIKPDGYEEPFEAYCDNEIDSGGWTVILRRFDGSVDFNRTWIDCKQGFGFLSTELWLGNEKVSYLTNQAQYELYINITLENGSSCNMKYTAFRISDEWSEYMLVSVGMYESDAACEWKEGDDSPPTDVSTSFTDCNDVFSAGNTQDGVYSIRPTEWTGSPFDVFCNMSIDGGSWTVIQRRVNGSTDFYHDWMSYKEGFGNLEHEFWLGNEKIYHLTNQSTYEYRFDFVYGSASYYHKYDRFRIDDETNKYKVTEVGSRSGNKGVSLLDTLNTEFSTHDRDNDKTSDDCAERHHGGWWYGGAYFHSYIKCRSFQSGGRDMSCTQNNANGDYNGGDGKNIFDWNSFCYIEYTEIKIRRIL